MSSITEILDMECRVIVYDLYNGKKRLIYVTTNDLTDVKGIEGGLKEIYSITGIQQPKWIKAKQPTKQAMMLQFAKDELAEYSRITREYAMTGVYLYNEKPVM